MPVLTTIGTAERCHRVSAMLLVLALALASLPFVPRTAEADHTVEYQYPLGQASITSNPAPELWFNSYDLSGGPWTGAVTEMNLWGYYYNKSGCTWASGTYAAGGLKLNGEWLILSRAYMITQKSDGILIVGTWSPLNPNSSATDNSSEMPFRIEGDAPRPSGSSCEVNLRTLHLYSSDPTHRGSHDDPPSDPELLEPEANAIVTSPGGPIFRVRSTDPEGDPYSGRVRLTRPNGTTTELQLSVALSDQESVGRVTGTELAPGTYTWAALSCGAVTFGICSSVTAPRTFTVLPDRAPTVPELLAPTPGHGYDSYSPNVFQARSTDPDGDPYQATIEVTGPKSLTLTSTPAASDQDATATPATGPLPPGSYTWRARSCQADQETLCSPWSGTRTFTVAPALNLPPATPVQIAPTEGGKLSPDGPQQFTITTADPESDYYTGTIEIRTSGGALVQTLTTPSRPSASNAVASASPSLPSGSYTWRAKACQTNSPGACSAYSLERTFAVDSPPDTPVLRSPADEHQFGPNDAQGFTIEAADPNGDAYRATIEITGPESRTLTSGSTASGQYASVLISPGSALPPGSYSWRAKACQSDAATLCSGWSGTRTFTVVG